MKRIIKAMLLCVLLCGTSAAQINNTPPVYYSGPAFTYCEALSHQHSEVTAYGVWGGRGLVYSECNNTGNHFYGNTVRLSYWWHSQTFWYDWSSDPDAFPRIAEWTPRPFTPLEVRYCRECLMVTGISSP